MPRRASSNSRMLEELSDLVDEMKATLKSYDFDLEECEIDEDECLHAFGEDVFRIYELLKEVATITREE